MQGKKEYQKKLFYCHTRLSQLVPEDDLYRRLSDLIDWDFIYPLCKDLYGTEGNPSLDPVVFFKLELAALLEGIQYDRQLMRRARAGDCRDCPLRSQCTTSSQGRTVTVSIYSDYYRRAAWRLSTPERKQALKKRSNLVESVFGFWKQFGGLAKIAPREQPQAYKKLLRCREYERKLAAILSFCAYFARKLGTDALSLLSKFTEYFSQRTKAIFIE